MELECGVFDCQMVILKNNLYHLSSITFLRAICWFFISHAYSLIRYKYRMKTHDWSTDSYAIVMLAVLLANMSGVPEGTIPFVSCTLRCTYKYSTINNLATYFDWIRMSYELWWIDRMFGMVISTSPFNWTRSCIYFPQWRTLSNSLLVY